MNLIKTSALNGAATLVRVGTMLLLNKVLAVHVGPGGYAVIGQLQNFAAVATTLSGGAITTGVTKYTAEHQQTRYTYRIWSSATAMSGLATLVLAGLLLLFRHRLATLVLADDSLSSIFVWLASGLGFAVLNALLLAVLNGRKSIRPLVVANILGSLVTATVALLLVLWNGLYGALVAVAIGQAAACTCTAVVFIHSHGQEWRGFFAGTDRKAMRALAGFGLMSLTSALVAPLSQIAVRDGLIHLLGLVDAGLWQALWRISDTHLMLLTSTLAIYFLPRFSELTDRRALRAEVARCYRFVLPLSIASATMLFLCRNILVNGLLSHQFSAISEVIGYQLVGDVLKVNSWVVGFTLISSGRARAFVVTEIAFSILFCALSLAGAKLDGLRGVAIGYGLTYAIYGSAVYLLFRRYVLSEEYRDGSTAA